MTPEKQTKKGKPTRLPTLLSLVYPGIGQFAQGRPIAGILFFATCTPAFMMFLVNALRPIIGVYRLAFYPSDQAKAPGWSGMLIWCVVVLVIYFISIWDTNRAYRQQRRSWSRQTHQIPPDLPKR